MDKGKLRDVSGTITTGGTAQTVLAECVGRRFLMYQNVSDADQWINFSGAATAGAGSLKFAAGMGQTWETFVPTGMMSIYGATTGKAFTVKEG